MRYLPDSAIIITAFLELGFVSLWVACGAGRERRPYFWARFALAVLAVPGLMAAIVWVVRMQVLSDGAARTVLPLVFFLGVIALMLVPGLLYLPLGPSPGQSDSDGGGGPGPDPPRPSPEAPRGGIPLPDADQARTRARDHNTPRFDRLKRRDPAHAPGRSPVRIRR